MSEINLNNSNEKLNLIIEKYSHIFYKYENVTDKKNIDEIKNINLQGFLYIFDTLDDSNFIHKIGKTEITIFERLSGYNKKNIKNIEFINCNLSTEREKIIKMFLNLKTNISPIRGTEYFSNCRNLLKVLLIITYFINDDFINSSDILDIIDNIIKDINSKNMDEIIVENYFLSNIFNTSRLIKKENNLLLTCEFCKSNFSCKSSLNYHQKNVKYCLDIQKQLNTSFKEVLFKCEYCNKDFNSKKIYVRHKDTCKKKLIQENISEKDIEINNLKLQYEKELEKKKNIYEKEIIEYKNELKNKNEQLKKIENELDNIKKYLFEKAFNKN